MEKSFKDWRPFFPLKEPRPEQVRALDWACEQIEKGERRLILEAGTGVGKSAIAVCLAGWIEDRERMDGTECSPGATVLTSQKLLQDQYIRDFAHARDIRASANFQCTGPVEGSCGETARLKKVAGPELKEKLRCYGCPYRQAKDDFVASSLGVTNYSYSISESVYAGELPIRRLFVLDEAHNVEDEVRRWTTVEVDDTEAHEMDLDLPEEGRDDAVGWLLGPFREKIRVNLETLGLKIKMKLETARPNRGLKSLAEKNDALDKRLCQINRLESKGGKLLVSYHDDPNRHRRSIRFQPSEVGELIEETLYSRATAVILMSATLLDRKVFSQSVGLPNAPYLSIPSTFDPKNFGLTFRPVGRMIRRDIDRTMKKMPGAIDRILRENLGHKGLIHTTNYRITRELGAALQGKWKDRILVQENAISRKEIIDEHIRSRRPTVLLSPSMMEGLDLRDDLARFQVICKVPYPDMSDPLVGVKPRSWYNWRTVRSIVQSVGRGVRSADDWAKTYILDEALLDLMESSMSMFPKLFQEHMEVDEP